jgi:ClpP class serine protease
LTADQALKYGLIDKVGYLDDAIKEAHDQAGRATTGRRSHTSGHRYCRSC